MLQMVKCREISESFLTSVPIDTSANEVMMSYSNHILFTDKITTEAEDIELLKENPWILLEACTMNFYDYLYENKNDVISSMFFYRVDNIRRLVKRVFKKSIFIKTKLQQSGVTIYQINVNGLSSYGKTLLNKMNFEDEIPFEWKKLYFYDKLSNCEREGIYAFKDYVCAHDVQVIKELEQLMRNPLFLSMDISALSISECEKNEIVQTILKNSAEAVICIEKHHSFYLKRICWKR